MHGKYRIAVLKWVGHWDMSIRLVSSNRETVKCHQIHSQVIERQHVKAWAQSIAYTLYGNYDLEIIRQDQRHFSARILAVFNISQGYYVEKDRCDRTTSLSSLAAYVAGHKIL